MLRFLFVLILTAIASYFALMIMPWWIPMLIAFCIILVLPLKTGLSFLAPATGAALCYLFITLIADQANEHILSGKMAVLFFHTPSYILMIGVTALTGFITAGLGGWIAATLRNLFRTTPEPESGPETLLPRQNPS